MPFSADVYCVDPKDVAQAWPQARDLIRCAIERTGLSEFADVEKDVLAGDQLLWLIISDHIEAAGTTHLVQTSDKPVCIITACAGSQRERWIALRHKIEHYAKTEGCKCVRLYGRVGWQRELKDYRVEHIIMEKAII